MINKHFRWLFYSSLTVWIEMRKLEKKKTARQHLIYKYTHFVHNFSRRYYILCGYNTILYGLCFFTAHLDCKRRIIFIVECAAENWTEGKYLIWRLISIALCVISDKRNPWTNIYVYYTGIGFLNFASSSWFHQPSRVWKMNN